MDIHFESRKLEKQSESPSACNMAFGTRGKKAWQRIQEIKAAPNLKVLMSISAANCHSLGGKKAGDWALDISANWRLIFNLGSGPLSRNEQDEIDYSQVTKIYISGTEDYH